MHKQQTIFPDNSSPLQETPAPSSGTAAERALAEAAARRAGAAAGQRPAEVDGRGGLEPVRYGDWEVKGLASDF